MPKPMRRDFAEQAIGLTLPAQHRNLKSLHDWLIDEIGMLPGEQIVASTNYQQGRFGRLPSHVLLVSTERIAYSHDSGLRSIPLHELDLTRIGVRVGLASGDVTLVTTSGEELTFRRGISIAMSQVAAALESLAGPRPTSAPRTSAAPHTAPAAEPEPSGGGGLSGYGDDVITFDPVSGLQAVRISGGTYDSHFAVWELDGALSQVNLLVNESEPYAGVALLGSQGSFGGLQISASGPWQVEFLDPADLPVLGDQNGQGDAVIMARGDAQGSERNQVVRVQGSSSGLVALWAYGADPQLLINEIGSYAGAVIVPAGTVCLALRCGGPWAITA